MSSECQAPMQSQGGIKNLTEWPQNWSTGLKFGANRAGPRPGPSQAPPGSWLGREAAQNQRCPVLPTPRKHLTNILTALEQGTLKIIGSDQSEDVPTLRCAGLLVSANKNVETDGRRTVGRGGLMRNQCIWVRKRNLASNRVPPNVQIEGPREQGPCAS